jgi:cytochrome c5
MHVGSNASVLTSGITGMFGCYLTGNRLVNKQEPLDRCFYSANVARRLVMVVLCSSLVLAMTPVASANGHESSGKEIVEKVCADCHTTGENGAPRIGDWKAWAKLASQGLTSLTGVALKGIRKMPPHGGNSELTDTEVERAITYMVNESGGLWVEPISKLALAAQRSGEEVVKAYCGKCHQTGFEGAPKIGDRTAWIPRLKQGFEVLVQSAIQGHGPMPSRGDVLNLTDSEVRAAVVYMVNGGVARTTRRSVVPSAEAERNHQFIAGAEKDSSIVRWLRSFWTWIWGDSVIPKQGPGHK